MELDSVLNDVTVYHDETSDAGPSHLKGHVLLWVPERVRGEHCSPLLGVHRFQYSPEQMLFERIRRIRETHNYDTRFHFCKISGTKWTRWDAPLLDASAVAVDALRHKFTKEFDRPLCCKLAVLFYPKKSDMSLYGGDRGKEQHLRHDETVLRILLKGAAHYLYGKGVSVRIRRIISDGEPRHRQLDPDRIVRRMLAEDDDTRAPLRDYVSFADDAHIDHVPSNHRKHDPEHASYRHAHHLQLADMLLGGVIHACHKGCRVCDPPRIGGEVDCKRDIIATPVKKMLDKRLRGRNFRFSGHSGAFTISEVAFDEGVVVFKQLPTKLAESALDGLQAELGYDVGGGSPIT